MDTLHQVVSVEPVPPSRLQVKLPRDLETITLRCLQKEPARRYANALELADDLGRYLAGRPIVARPVGPVERAWKWAQRRPAAAALLLVIALSAAALSAGGWVYNVKLQRETTRALDAEGQARENEKAARKAEGAAKEQEAAARKAEGEARAQEALAKQAQAETERARRQTEKERNRAEENFGRGVGAVDHMLREVGAVELADVPQMEPVRKRLLTEALVYYNTFLQQRADDPAVRWEVARATANRADIQEMLGEHADAEKSY